MHLLPMTRGDLLKYLPRGGVVAEIGVLRGDFSKIILKNTAPACLHLIDPWIHQERDDYAHDPANMDNAGHDDNHVHVLKTFRRPIRKGQVTVNRDYSTDALSRFAENTFDWVYIDGLHTYDGVMADLEGYGARLKDDGLILGHDYSNQQAALDMGFGVVEAVNDFVKKGDFTFVALTQELFPTFVLAGKGAAAKVNALIEALALEVPGIVEIRDFPERPFLHKNYDLTGRKGRRKLRVIQSF